jgi:hypothetical protein
MNPHSLSFLNAADISRSTFGGSFEKYSAWLADPAFADVTQGGDAFASPPQF